MDKMEELINLKLSSYEVAALYHTLEKLIFLMKQQRLAESKVVNSNAKYFMKKLMMESEKAGMLNLLTLSTDDTDGE